MEVTSGVQKEKSIIECEKVLRVIPSSDKSVYAIFDGRYETKLYILSSLTDKILFDSSLVGPIHEKIRKHSSGYAAMFDFSPDNKKFVIFSGDYIFVYDLEHLILNFFTFSGEVLQVNFLTNEKIVCLKKLTVSVVDISKQPPEETEKEIDKNWNDFYGRVFFNRKDAIYLDFTTDEFAQNNRERPLTKILNLDGKVSIGPTIEGLTHALIPFYTCRSNCLITFGSSNFRGDLIIDFSEYLANGICKKFDLKGILWEVFGVKCIQIEIKVSNADVEIEGKEYGYYLFDIKDKIFIVKWNNETQRYQILAVQKQNFEQFSLATIIGCGLYGSGDKWHQFLTRGLYDPRLFLLIWAFTK